MRMPFSRKSKRARNGPCNPHAALEQGAVIDTPLCGLCDEHQSSDYFSLPNEPQHQQQHQHCYVPTMTECTAAMTTSSLHSTTSFVVEQDLCPVTGAYANISDHYYIYPGVIGQGNYGVVRECIHLATGQSFAVKTISKSKIGRLDHLQREIYLLANLNHRGIMRMVDYYEDAEFIHIIMEKYTGGELFDQIVANNDSSGCLSERRATTIIKQLLEAVAYLHDNGVVHRDIKPENILFESKRDDANIKLIDFGLSRQHDKSEGPMSNPVGTTYYMAPEVLKGQYDNSCDIWAVGIVTYILLAGYPPFNGSTDLEIQDSIERGWLHFQGSQWLFKSDGAIDFIRCLLRRDRKKRFTAREALMHPWIQNNVM